MARNHTAIHLAKKSAALTLCNRSAGSVPSTTSLSEFKALKDSTRCKHCEGVLKKQTVA